MKKDWFECLKSEFDKYDINDIDFENTKNPNEKTLCIGIARRGNIIYDPYEETVSITLNYHKVDYEKREYLLNSLKKLELIFTNRKVKSDD